MARSTGFEPAIFSVTGRRDRPTSLRAQNSIYVSIYAPYLQPWRRVGLNAIIERYIRCRCSSVGRAALS